MVRARRGLGGAARPAGARRQRSSLAVAAGGRGDAAADRRRGRDAGRHRHRHLPGDAAGARGLRRRTGGRPGQGRPAAAGPHRRTSSGCCGWRAASRARCRRGRSRSRGPAPSWPSWTRSSSSPARPPSSTRRWSRSTTSCGAWPSSVPAGPVPRIPARGRDQLRDHQRPRASPTKTSSPPSSSTSRRARGTPKARLAYLFPNSHSAQIVVRLQAGPERSRAPPGARADRSRGRRHDAARGLRRGRQAGALLRAAKAAATSSPARRSSSTALARALKDALLRPLRASPSW